MRQAGLSGPEASLSPIHASFAGEVQWNNELFRTLDLNSRRHYSNIILSSLSSFFSDHLMLFLAVMLVVVHHHEHQE